MEGPSDDHLQLPGVFDHLRGQFRRGDRGVLGLLLPPPETVIVGRPQHPAPLGKEGEKRVKKGIWRRFGGIGRS